MLNINEEIWKPVVEFPTLYKISNKGRVASYRKVLATNVLNSGYLSVQLKVNGININRTVHRLVASAFLENPEGKREVNHIDGNKLNNAVTNLEWVTASENKLHALRIGLKSTDNGLMGFKRGERSKYYNVSWDSSRQKWKTGIRDKGQTYGQKRFDCEIEAALYVNFILDKYGFTDRPKNIID